MVPKKSSEVMLVKSWHNAWKRDDADLQHVDFKKVYLVDNFLKSRFRGGELEILVQWLGYHPIYNTWEPFENIQGAFKDVQLAFFEESPTSGRAQSKSRGRNARLRKLLRQFFAPTVFQASVTPDSDDTTTAQLPSKRRRRYRSTRSPDASEAETISRTLRSRTVIAEKPLFHLTRTPFVVCPTTGTPRHETVTCWMSQDVFTRLLGVLTRRNASGKRPEKSSILTNNSYHLRLSHAKCELFRLLGLPKHPLDLFYQIFDPASMQYVIQANVDEVAVLERFGPLLHKYDTVSCSLGLLHPRKILCCYQTPEKKFVDEVEWYPAIDGIYHGSSFISRGILTFTYPLLVWSYHAHQAFTELLNQVEISTLLAVPSLCFHPLESCSEAASGTSFIFPDQEPKQARFSLLSFVHWWETQNLGVQVHMSTPVPSKKSWNLLLVKGCLAQVQLFVQLLFQSILYALFHDHAMAQPNLVVYLFLPPAYRKSHASSWELLRLFSKCLGPKYEIPQKEIDLLHASPRKYILPMECKQLDNFLAIAAFPNFVELNTLPDDVDATAAHDPKLARLFQLYDVVPGKGATLENKVFRTLFRSVSAQYPFGLHGPPAVVSFVIQNVCRELAWAHLLQFKSKDAQEPKYIPLMIRGFKHILKLVKSDSAGPLLLSELDELFNNPIQMKEEQTCSHLQALVGLLECILHTNVVKSIHIPELDVHGMFGDALAKLHNATTYQGLLDQLRPSALKVASHCFGNVIPVESYASATISPLEHLLENDALESLLAANSRSHFMHLGFQAKYSDSPPVTHFPYTAMKHTPDLFFQNRIELWKGASMPPSAER